MFRVVQSNWNGKGSFECSANLTALLPAFHVQQDDAMYNASQKFGNVLT